MQSLRRFRKLVVLAALVWLPMSVSPQICATHAMVAHIGGAQHPTLIAPEEMSVAEAARAAAQPPLLVIDAATFLQSVDDCDTGCDMKSMCAFAAMTALMSSTSDLTVANDTPVPRLSAVAFSSRELSPDNVSLENKIVAVSEKTGLKLDDAALKAQIADSGYEVKTIERVTASIADVRAATKARQA